MSVLVKSNNVSVPSRPDGSLYRFELVMFGNADRFYCDSIFEIAQMLIPNFSSEKSNEQNLKAMFMHATRVQVAVQAHLELAYKEEIAELSPQELALLREPLAPSAPMKWGSALPLVIIDALYAPFTHAPAPSAVVDDEGNSNILWIRVTGGINEYIRSLDEIGYISLSIAREVIP